MLLVFYAFLAAAPLLAILGLIALRFEKCSRTTLISRTQTLLIGIGAAVQIMAVFVMLFSPMPNVRQGAMTAWFLATAIYAIDGVIAILMRLLQMRNERKNTNSAA